MPWYVTAFGACVAALGISFAIIFGFGINQAFAFESDGETYPNTLEGITVTLNDSLTAPPDSICQTWYTVNIFPIRGSAATPTAQTAAGAVTMRFENWTHVDRGNPWFIYFNCGQSTEGVTGIPTGLDYAARMAYDAVAGWWGLNPSVLSPTITFAHANVGGQLYTNQDFIKWLVNNSDYRARYESSDWQTPGAAVSSNIFAWEAPTTNPQFTISVAKWNNANQYEIIDTISPAPYSGIYTVTSSGRYRFTFNYYINGVIHYDTVPASGYYTIEVSTTPTQMYFGEITYTLAGKSTIEWVIKAQVYNANTVKVQRSQIDSNTWFDVTELWQSTSTPNLWQSWTVREDDNYKYRLVALDSNGAQVFQAIVFPDGGQSGTDAFEEMWDDAYNWFIDIWNTFTTLIQSFLTILPSDLANFIFVSITFLVVLGIILRVV